MSWILENTGELLCNLLAGEAFLISKTQNVRYRKKRFVNLTENTYISTEQKNSLINQVF